MTRPHTAPPHPESVLPHLSTYTRTLAVSLERMYENALDWEHLPYVHAGSFAAIECLDAGSWGWRARLQDASGNDSVIELALDRSCRRWITRNLEGRAAGNEIWTHVFVTGERQLDLVIDFFAPGIEPARRASVGAAYARLYDTLYDEDEAMMLERQRQLDLRIAPTAETSVTLAPRSELSLPHEFQLAGRPYVLREHEAGLLAHAAVCPHQLGPMTNAEIDGGEIICPWHGYRFALADGACTSGASCRIAPAARVAETAAGVVVEVGGN